LAMAGNSNTFEQAREYLECTCKSTMNSGIFLYNKSDRQSLPPPFFYFTALTRTTPPLSIRLLHTGGSWWFITFVRLSFFSRR
jgi:hypothetical protein